MENDLGDKESFTMPEVRIILIGGRWAGKSWSGNTILRKERFECGRTRTSQSEGRHAEVEGRHLVVVDTPGWSSSHFVNETPQGDKDRFKLSVSKCPPGPHVFLLVIPIDSAFSEEQRRIMEEHMRLLGERVWRYTMVLFTCGDYLGDMTIEQHIESEGDALKWVVGRCRNRYHVINNKERSNSSQVTQLLEKIDEMVCDDDSGFYEVDQQMLKIKEKQQEVAARAEERRRRAEEQRQQINPLVSEMKPIPKLRMILLGGRGVGKTSVGNSILGIKAQEDGKRTAHSVTQEGFVGKTEIILVDTPGWWKGFSASDTSAVIREELMRSMFLCPPGPHVFLLMIDSDASFNRKHLEAVTTHMELLGEGVWRHAIVVFTRGDWLRAHSIEEYIEGEGEALGSLVEKCGNRYHVIDNKNADDGTQIAELLEKVTGTVAHNTGAHFSPDEMIFFEIEKKRKRAKEAARLRQTEVKSKRKALEDTRNELQNLKIMMLGEKTAGKSTTGNNLLRRVVFPSSQTDYCQVEEAEVAGRLITLIDTPGWRRHASSSRDETDKEIVKSMSLSPLGVHAILLVVPLDVVFGEAQQAALEEQMSLFGSRVWRHSIVLFTFGDLLAEKSVEEHIEREHSALRWLVDKCENRYHVMNNMKENDTRQVAELFEKIEEMVAGNSGRLFSPDMNDLQVRLSEKICQRQIKHVLMQHIEEGYRKRELEMMMGFRNTLIHLQNEVKESVTSPPPRSPMFSLNKIKGNAQSKKDGKEETIATKLSQEIENLNKHILRSTALLGNSMDFLIPEFKGTTPESLFAKSVLDKRPPSSNFDKVLTWLSDLQISTSVDNKLSLNFSQSSGYRSVTAQDHQVFHTKAVRGATPGSPVAESLLDRRRTSGKLDKVLTWLSNSEMSTEVDNGLSLNSCQSTGYRSVLPQDPQEIHTDGDISK